jgi:hypothetical protein
MSGVRLQDLPETPRAAWLALRDELSRMLGDDLVAIWAYGGTTAIEDRPHTGDLDTYVLLGAKPDEATAGRIVDAEQAIARDRAVEWDAWYVLEADARRPDPPHHALRPERRDTSWAINRAHWLAGRFALIHGPEPVRIVPPPTRPELESEMSRELEHIERHIVEGDTDPYEATYALLNGSRILHALETGSVALSKRAAGIWALEHLPDRWHPPLQAALRSYDGKATPDDPAFLAAEMAPFIAFVRERLPSDRPADELPRWSGY